MKKSLALTLALVFVLGLAGTAFANPYSDVPAGHWAYKAVMDLTKAGVVEGHAGKFTGNANMTRYEMAAITARAMAKSDKADAATKATIDKLAVEFSQELNNMGVKVAKLEKQLGNWKFGGDARIRYQENFNLNGMDKTVQIGLKDGKQVVDNDGNVVAGPKVAVKSQDKSDTRFQTRVRITAQNNINDNTVVNVRLMQQNTNNNKKDGASGTSSDGTFELETMKITFKQAIGSADIQVGREPLWLGAAGLAADSLGVDGIRIVDKSHDFKWMLAAVDAKKQSAIAGDDTKTLWIAEASYPIFEGMTLTATKAKADMEQRYAFDSTIVGLKYGFGDWTLAGDYVKNSADAAKAVKDSDKGYYTSLWYKGADVAKPGSWGVYVDYRQVGGNAIDGGLTTLNSFKQYSKDAANFNGGIKGMGAGFNYAFMKNGKFTFAYEDLKDRDGNVNYNNFYYARAEFFF